MSFRRGFGRPRRRGAGISWLAAAWFYRQRRPNDTILLLDNHDDFGGHAKRNEILVGDRLLLGYGGSEALQSPNALYSEVARGLLRSLGVEIERFETAFDRDLYPSLGLSRGVFFIGRPSASTRWSPATRCGWLPTTSPLTG
jgi:spermidine dehydrogenase